VSRFFAPVPLDFTQALRTGQLRPFAYLVGCYLADESFRTKNTDGGIVTLHVASLAELCEVHPVTIRRALRALEQAGWIVCEGVDERQRKPWRIRLTELALEPHCDSTATPELRHESQSSTGVVAVEVAEIPAPQAGERPTPVAVAVAVEENTNETRRDETREGPVSEEKLDHLLGDATPAAADDTTDRMLAALAELDSPNRISLPGDGDFLDFIAAGHRAGQITTGEALNREQLHRLVLAGREAEV
jgi:Helix-turn-helix domain